MRILAALFSVALAFVITPSTGQTAIFNVPSSPGPIKANSPLSAPTNVQRVLPGGVNKIRDENPCAPHDGPNGAAWCRQLLKDDAFVLVWDWSPSCGASNCSPTGFSIYRVDGGRHQHVGGIAGGPQLTFAGVPTYMVSAYHGTCYVVVAYNHNVQSGPSATFCLP